MATRIHGLDRRVLAALPTAQRTDDFNPAAWLTALSSIGGGFALMSGRSLAFMVQDCDAGALSGVMSHVIGRRDRQEALKRAIEQRQNGETA